MAIVTGGNTGVGYETVVALLRKRAKVYLAARNEIKAREAMTELQSRPGTEAGEVEFIYLDLSALRSVKAAAAEFAQRESRLDFLFNSAGIKSASLGEKTADGYELHLGVNALAPYYFTMQIMPLLLATAKKTPEAPPRVCFTSSSAHCFAPPNSFDPESLDDLPARQYGTSAALWQLYGISKVRGIRGWR